MAQDALRKADGKVKDAVGIIQDRLGRKAEAESKERERVNNLLKRFEADGATRDMVVEAMRRAKETARGDGLWVRFFRCPLELAYAVMAYAVMAYMAMASMAMAYMVMAHMVMAYMAMANIVMVR